MKIYVQSASQERDYYWIEVGRDAGFEALTSSPHPRYEELLERIDPETPSLLIAAVPPKQLFLLVKGIVSQRRDRQGRFIQNSLLFIFDQTEETAVRVLAAMFLTPTEEGVMSVAFSSDGRLILTGSWNGTVRLWQASSGKQVVQWEGHTDRVDSVAFSPDGKQVLTGSWDQTARLWKTSSGKQLIVFKEDRGAVNSVAFSPDGKQVLTGALDGTVRLWETSNGKQLTVFESHTFVMSSVAFSPDGKQVLTGALDGTVRLWQASSGKQVVQWERHTDRVDSVAFSPDGKQVLTGSWDGTARLWEIGSGQQLIVFKGHTDRVNSVVFSPDSRLILTGSLDGTACLWEAYSGKQLIVFKEDRGAVNSVAFSSDGKQVLTGALDGIVRLWETSSGKELMDFTPTEESQKMEHPSFHSGWLTQINSCITDAPRGTFQVNSALPEVVNAIIKEGTRQANRQRASLFPSKKVALAQNSLQRREELADLLYQVPLPLKGSQRKIIPLVVVTGNKAPETLIRAHAWRILTLLSEHEHWYSPPKLSQDTLRFVALLGVSVLCAVILALIILLIKR